MISSVVHDLPCKRSFGKVGRADVIVEASSDPGSKAEVMCLAQAMGSCLLTAAAGPRVGLYQAGAPLSRDFLAFRGAAEDPLVSLMLAALVVEEARRARMPLGPWDRPATEPVMVSPEGLHRRAGGGEGSLVPRKTNGSTRISLVGAGALGTWAAVGLGLANGTPMRMRIFDADPISATNLNRQVLFEGKVNRPKSTVMADRLSAMFPQIEASGEVAAVDHGNLADAFDADAVLSAPDNFSTRALLHQGSLTSGTPLVNGGTSAFGADVAAYVPGSSPCLECSMRVAHVAEAVGEAEERARCAGVAEASVVTSNALAGALMAYEARAALAGRPARGVIEYDGRAPTTRLGVRSVREPCDCHKASTRPQ